jgi:hypothetical protein
MACAGIYRASVDIQPSREAAPEPQQALLLLYSRRALEINGSAPLKLFRVFNPKLPERHGFFGTFKDYGELRGHLLLPSLHAPIWDWRIVEILANPVLSLEGSG